jgi:hypothetical protein
MLQRSVLVLATTLLATPAVAQDATDSWSDVKISDLLSTATVLDESGALWSGEVVRLNADGLDLVQANGEERHFTVSQVRRLETIGKCGGGLYQILFGEFKLCRDSIKNGGLIGAGLGAVVGLGGAWVQSRGIGLPEGGWVGYPLLVGAHLGAYGLVADFIWPGQRRLTLYQAAGTNSVQRGSFGGRGPSTPMTLTASIRW